MGRQLLSFCLQAQAGLTLLQLQLLLLLEELGPLQLAALAQAVQDLSLTALAEALSAVLQLAQLGQGLAASSLMHVRSSLQTRSQAVLLLLLPSPHLLLLRLHLLKVMGQLPHPAVHACPCRPSLAAGPQLQKLQPAAELVGLSARMEEKEKDTTRSMTATMHRWGLSFQPHCLCAAVQHAACSAMTPCHGDELTPFRCIYLMLVD